MKNLNCGMDKTQDTTHDDIKRLPEFCMTPRSRSEMTAFMQLANRKHFAEHYLQPLLCIKKVKDHNIARKYIKMSYTLGM